jgi:hypothetical protein
VRRVSVQALRKQACCSRAAKLGEQIPRDILDREMPCDGESDGDGGVDVSAGYVL